MEKMISKYGREKGELRTFGFDENIVERLDRLVWLDNYHEHVKAQDELISMGVQILPVMHRLMGADSAILRKEAAKIIKRIGNKTSLPVAMAMLEDPFGDIRWIAAEILVKIGRSSLKPLLKKLIEDSHSVFFREGVHHVLSELIRKDDPGELLELKHILLNVEFQETVSLKVSRILNKNLI
jgi:HEAT repeat protein